MTIGAVPRARAARIGARIGDGPANESSRPLRAGPYPMMTALQQIAPFERWTDPCCRPHMPHDVPHAFDYGTPWPTD
eukprot:gene6112-6187_t